MNPQEGPPSHHTPKHDAYSATVVLMMSESPEARHASEWLIRKHQHACAHFPSGMGGWTGHSPGSVMASTPTL